MVEVKRKLVREVRGRRGRGEEGFGGRCSTLSG